MRDLADKLRNACRSAAKGDKVVTIHLFGIQNAALLDGMNVHDLAEEAGIGRSFGTELRKGVRLADYVQVSQTP